MSAPVEIQWHDLCGHIESIMQRAYLDEKDGVVWVTKSGKIWGAPKVPNQVPEDAVIQIVVQWGMRPKIGGIPSTLPDKEPEIK